MWIENLQMFKMDLEMAQDHLGGGGGPQESRGIGWEDHFLPHKFIKRSFECWVTSTEQLLNSGRGSPFSLKGGRIKYKRQRERQKEFGMETCPRKGVVKEEKFPHSRKPSYRRVCGEFWNLRGQQTGREKKKTQNTHLTTTPSREVAQMLASTTSEWGWTRRRTLHHRCLG